MTRRNPDRQSGQAVLIGVMALILLGASFGSSMYYIGAKTMLARQQTSVSQSSKVVHNALMAFVAKNYRLPCPADGTLARGAANEGVENCGLGNASHGVVPWQTIGISYLDGEDGWHHRVGYAPSSSLVTNTPYQYSKISDLTSSDDAVGMINCVTDCSAAASKYAYALISYGEDGAGAYTETGSQVAAPLATSHQFQNTQATAFSGAGSFNNWQTNIQSNAGSSYYDDVMLTFTSRQICDAINGSLHGSSDRPYCNPAGMLGAQSNQNLSKKLGNTVGQPSYSGTNITAGSAANAQAFSSDASCSGVSCTAASGTLTMNGNAGQVSLRSTESGGTGISLTTGSPTLTSYVDQIGATSSLCTDCIDPTLNAYLVPDQYLAYELDDPYSSFALVVALVDGGMTVNVQAFASATPHTPSTWVKVGTLSLNNGGKYQYSDANPACLGPGLDAQAGAANARTAPKWYDTLTGGTYSTTKVAAENSNGNSYPPPTLSQQWPTVTFGDTLNNYDNVRDYQFANQTFKDSDGTVLKFNVLQFSLGGSPVSGNSTSTYKDLAGTSDSAYSAGKYHYGMLLEGTGVCPTYAGTTVTIGGTVTGGNTVKLNFTNSTAIVSGGLGGTISVSYPVTATDTTTTIATGLVTAINEEATLRGAGISATNFNTTTNDFGSTIQIAFEEDVTTGTGTTVSNGSANGTTETVSLVSAGKFTASSQVCDLRGLGVAPTYSDTTNLAQDEWWNPPVNLTMDCSLKSGLSLQ